MVALQSAVEDKIGTHRAADGERIPLRRIVPARQTQGPDHERAAAAEFRDEHLGHAHDQRFVALLRHERLERQYRQHLHG
ncbi:MAG TPA: hypothetical protein VIL19_07280 [Casimicrobiaceae bacterium]